MVKCAVGVLMVLAVTAVHGQSGARTALLEADAAISTGSYVNGVGATLPKALGRDGILMWPGAAPVRGDSIARLFFDSQVILLGATRFSWQPLRIDFSDDSTLATIVGVATLDRPKDKMLPAYHRIGRSMTVWVRTSGTWHLTAFTLVNLIPPTGETLWREIFGKRELPSIVASGPAAKFITADAKLGNDLRSLQAARAFSAAAAPDGLTMSVTGELNLGPDAIRRAFAANLAQWGWTTVAAGASKDGTLGWTISQATITPPGGGKVLKSNFLTFWRQQTGGAVRFSAIGGAGRP